MKLTATVLDPSSLKREESIFHTANGYLGVRGCFEEGYPEGFDSIRGCYINGFYENIKAGHTETLFGFPETAQHMINLPDMQTTRLIADGEEFSPFRGSALEYKRTLDMANGTAVRYVHWRSPKGKELRVSFRRMASFTTQELFLTKITVEGVNCSGELTVISECNCDIYNEHYIRMSSAGLHGSGRAFALCGTSQSKLSLVAAMGCRANRGESKVSLTPSGFRITLTMDYGSEPAVIEKYCVYSDSLRSENCEKHALKILDTSMLSSAGKLFTEQKSYLDVFWRECGVRIHGNDEAAQGMTFNLYGLLQSAGGGGIGNISIMGLSGEEYKGRDFRDTEVYTLPFFLFTHPEQAKALLGYRYAILDGAREHARTLGHGKGALYPWRAIIGIEHSARYHINGDIAHAFLQYYDVTGDTGFMADKGAEVLIETARLWLNAGQYDRQGRLCFNCVVGPDEYAGIVNNNYYTNLAAKRNLLGAARICDVLKQERLYEGVAEKLGLTNEELAAFEKAAGDIYIPYDEKLDINPRDDGFLDKAKWDLAATPKGNFPIIAHYHPLSIYRHQLCDQADAVLAHYLFEDAAESTMRNSFDYYEPITTHDSMLSASVFSIMASRLDMPEKAYNYFLRAVRADLDNICGNTGDGLHVANMGGAYLALTAGFAGLRIRGDGPHFRFTLPKQWTGYEFRFRYAGSLLHVSVKGSDVKITLESGNPVLVFVDGTSYKVKDSLPIMDVVL